MEPVSEPAPEVVSVHLWDIPTRRIPAALTHMAADRRRLRGTPGLWFARSVGTGDDTTFASQHPNLRRWGLIASWRDQAALTGAERSHPVFAGWQSIAEHTDRTLLRPLTSRGRWAGRAPFEPAAGAALSWAGPVAAITRARLTPARIRRFWSQSRPIARELQQADGLLRAVPIGEAPIGWQGTFSCWRDAAALRAFAYGQPRHLQAIDRTPTEGWYREELFARFAILAAGPGEPDTPSTDIATDHAEGRAGGPLAPPRR
jgi:hypothetical protein